MPRPGSLREPLASQGKVVSHMLSKCLSFASFPRLESAALDHLQCSLILAGEVQQGAQFDGEIVALLNQCWVLQQLGQALPRALAATLLELVSLVEDASIGRIGRKRLVERPQGLAGRMKDVEVRDAQVTPYGGESRPKLRRLLPKGNRLLMAPPVVEQVAQVVARLPHPWDWPRWRPGGLRSPQAGWGSSSRRERRRPGVLRLR